MDTTQLIYLRNFFFKAFLIGLVAFFILLIGTALLWEQWSFLILEIFKVDEPTLGKMVVNSFLNSRMIIIFLLLVPAIALHLVIKKSK